MFKHTVMKETMLGYPFFSLITQKLIKETLILIFNLTDILKASSFLLITFHLKNTNTNCKYRETAHNTSLRKGKVNKNSGP